MSLLKDAGALQGVLELAMTSFLRDHPPTVRFNHLDRVPELHSLILLCLRKYINFSSFIAFAV